MFDIWQIVQTTNVSVFHVDAHSVQILWNDGITITEEQTRIQAVEVDPDSSDLKGLTLWRYQKCGHLGENVTNRRAQD